jgi:hypothetical protein
VSRISESPARYDREIRIEVGRTRVIEEIPVNELDIFTAALAIDSSSEHAAYLDGACAGSPCPVPRGSSIVD